MYTVWILNQHQGWVKVNSFDSKAEAVTCAERYGRLDVKYQVKLGGEVLVSN